ncbi:MAG: copper amine oxidase N-terminal domain-containing protein [Oscillospiraceae bacterium]|nr:copper amine oxidase N-terminal domain-containing protein [Oscillospiraceae bacterium]
MKAKIFISALLTAAMATMSVPAMAADDDIKVFIDGEQIQFEVQPQIINDYTMVPMRAIFEKLGYTVEWFGEIQMIDAVNRITDKEMMLWIGEPAMTLVSASGVDRYLFLDDDSYCTPIFQALDMAPIIVDGNTLVPVRAISEASGCAVIWDGSNRSVNIFTAYSNDELVPVVIDPVIPPAIIPTESPFTVPQPPMPPTVGTVETIPQSPASNSYEPDMATRGRMATKYSENALQKITKTPDNIGLITSVTNTIYNEIYYNDAFVYLLSQLSSSQSTSLMKQAESAAYNTYRYVYNNMQYGSSVTDAEALNAAAAEYLEVLQSSLVSLFQ